jgi:hypothetical protein
MPQPPQLFVLVVIFVSQPFVAFMSQSANPALQVNAHDAFTQETVAFGTGAQAWPHIPQLWTSDPRLMHAPLQREVPIGHEHIPAEHTPFVGQLNPQPPQLCASVCVLTHVPPQFVVPVGHAVWQFPLTQIVPIPHVVLHEPQCWGSVARFTHAPLQFVWPIGQPIWHTPLEHV